VSVDFKGTAAVVRRALERSFTALDPGDAVWRGKAGPDGAEVRVDLEPYADDRAAVRITARVAEAPELTPSVALACTLENDALVFGRFRHEDGAIVIEQSVLGGHTLHTEEVRISVWAVGWAAGAFAERIRNRLDGTVVEHPLPVPRAEPRRGAEERVQSARERVERFLRERYGEFEDDPHWGYHGGFGSARVFCTVRHYLETSTAVVVASPLLSGVQPSPELAMALHAITARETLGRFALSEEHGELWCEHAVLGDDLDADELHTAIDSVARIADAEDDRLQGRFGGQRYADLTGG
jgi:hypothetical protein